MNDLVTLKESTDTFYVLQMLSQICFSQRNSRKKAETVVHQIFKDRFCKLVILAKILTDGGKEFVNAWNE
jgi:hypothetical protein